jgi:hypothetical protein
MQACAMSPRGRWGPNHDVALQEWQDSGSAGAFSGEAAAAGARSMLPYRFWGPLRVLHV